MRLHELLNEAPLQDFQLFGDPNTPGSFRADDLRAASSKKWLEKLGSAFSRTKQKFNIYMLNAHMDMHQYSDERGSQVQMPVGIKHYSSYAQAYTGRGFKQMFGFLPPDHEQSISVLFTFNEGSGRIPFTQWMVAHRLMHAIYIGRDKSFAPILDNIDRPLTELFDIGATITALWAENEDEADAVYAPATTKAMYAARLFGNTRALRDGNLQSWSEWLPELGAEYLIKGQIKFRKPDIHGQSVYLVHNRKSVDQETLNQILQDLEDNLNKLHHQLFQHCIGKIFVV